jgi:diguanylate cyclase (GGDEF)-like protein
MTRIRPTLQITLALVFLSCAILIVANLLFDVFSDPQAQVIRVRNAVAESLATQAAVLLQRGNIKALELTLSAIRRQDPNIRSVAVRQGDKAIVAQSGDHIAAWKEQDGEASAVTRVYVPLLNGGERWGSFEMSYVPDEHGRLYRTLTHPLWITLLFVVSIGTLVYWVYLRRALVYLDPTAVIPERVQLAFDVMTEGVVVLDRAGRVLLANSAFRALPGEGATDPVGKSLSTLPWLAAGLAEEAAEHPWAKAIDTGVPQMAHAVEVVAPDKSRKTLMVNCAPISDTRGVVKGCLVTFGDLTELHLANARLSEALAELGASRDQIYQKSIELEHLATRDTLTGCLTRRAFFERMAQAREEARRNGTPLSCLLLDIDRFKSVNDTFGHAAGDQVIQEVGSLLRGSLRAADIIGRYGGDEFLVGMPGCDLDHGIAIAQKISDRVEKECGVGISGLSVTVSIGVATFGTRTEDVAEILNQADKALYAAKSAGRNRVLGAPSAGSIH